ncbi:MAG: GCN5 family acetyltransferase [Candidatus Aegiribacteria sp. MLS_C]|nr:MAG: GCN5 family acetyltransferase [Candidatus Aegiribacteria sp. MLS_C]
MNIHGLEKLLDPKRIALIGVTINPNSVGGKVLSNLIGGAYRGVVYPVNPVSEAIMGVPCYPDLDSLPRVPDLAMVCTPADKVPGTVEKCGQIGIKGVIVMSAGFEESGAEGRELAGKLREVLDRYPGMRMLGPNCLGIVVPGIKLNASFAPGLPGEGGVAFISQSGALVTSVLDWAREKKIGFSSFVSIGNAMDVDFADLIDYFGEDDKTDSIIMYIESIKDARKFMTASRAFARTKPLIVYKAGRFPGSAAVAASHTGAMVSEDSVYDAAFRRAGMARVLNIGEIFDCVELVGRNRFPGGPRLGILTNAGGPGVMAVDTLMELGGRLAELDPSSIDALGSFLPPFWSGTNPVDILGDANSRRYEKAAGVILADGGVDALLVILTPQAMTDADKVALRIGKLSASTRKPVLAAWLGGESIRGSMVHLAEEGVATYDTPEQAVRAFMTLVDYADNLEDLYETPRDILADFSGEQESMRQRFLSMMPDDERTLSEPESKELLELYDIGVAKPMICRSREEAADAALKMGFPVVLKVHSPRITHKTEVGGVEVGIASSESLEMAWDRIMRTVSERAPEAEVEGISVQPMLQTGEGTEMILGARRDPVFGSVIMAGSGGVAAEIWGDKALGLPPLNEHLADRMLRSLKVFPLLDGFRGRPPVDLEQLKRVMMRFSYLISDNPEIVEMDVNPLLCTSDQVTALDARIVVRPGPGQERSYAHLALRPYPVEYVTRKMLPDSTEVLLRPIKPEDEPMWLEMLGSCSRESIYSRFGFFYNWANHEAAARYCYIDYDREIAIVAEVSEEAGKHIHAIGRLIADPDLRTVEYAILVDDRWQNRGLGSMVTEYCEEIAGRWGLSRIVAQTTVDNTRMIHLFESRGYTVTRDSSSGEVRVRKDLTT